MQKKNIRENKDRKVTILVMLNCSTEKEGKKFFKDLKLRAFPVGDLIRRWTVEVPLSKTQEISTILEKEQLVKQVIV